MGLTVYTTLPDEQSAADLARAALEAGLAACCNFWPVRTMYHWQGEFHDDTEYVLLFKAARDNYPALEAFITDRHPYDLPAIVALPWEAAFEPYRQWVREP